MADTNFEPYDREALTSHRVSPIILHAGEEFAGQPTVFIDQDFIALQACTKNSLVADANNGIVLQEKLHLMAMPDQIGLGFYWKLNPLLLTCLASTTPTPVPVLVKQSPAILQGADAIGAGNDFLKGFSDL